MSISNCSSCGADSRAAPITGAVTRTDPVTKAEVPAGVRGNGLPSGEAKPAGVQNVSGVASVSSGGLGVLLLGQMV